MQGGTRGRAPRKVPQGRSRGRAAAQRPAKPGDSRPRRARNESPRRQVLYFPDRASLRKWFEAHHATDREVWIGYFKRGSGRQGVTYDEAVEEALCFGWIDGQVRSLDEKSYANRYTPRRSGSRWSRANVARAKLLARDGQMHTAGRAAFAARSSQSPDYSFGERPQRFNARLAREFRSAKRAWAYFQQQSPSYRKTATFWVMSARRTETRLRRLAILVKSSSRSRKINLLAPVSSD